MSLNSTFLLIRQNMNRYFCPIGFTLGIIGCSFNILLFSQKQFRTISCCTCKFILYYIKNINSSLLEPSNIDLYEK